MRESLRAQPDEPILVTASPHTVDLATEVAVEAYRAGADPAILFENDAFYYAQFKHLTDAQLRKTSAHCLGLADYVRGYVWLQGVEDPSGMRRVPPPKFAAMFEGEEAHHRKSLEKKPKSVGVRLGLVTRARARTYGFNYTAWKRMMEAAIAVDYEEMGRAGKAVLARLRRPGRVRLTAENGTDLALRLVGEPRKVAFDDGVLSDEDLAAGNVNTSLPAGIVDVAPLEDSAEGTFVSDVGVPQVGTLIEGLSWTFAGGRVVDFSAKRNVKSAQLNYAEASGAKDRFASIGIGVNRRYAPGFLGSGFARGAVTVRIGDNRDLGGKNESSYGFEGYLTEATVTIDGDVLVDRGRLLP